MKDEIYSGIRNAMERGEPLEKAKQSFLNAGYNPQEVEEAVKMINSGVSEVVQGNEMPKQDMKKPMAKELPPLPKPQKEKMKSVNGRKMLVFGMIVSALVLLTAIGYFIYILVTS